jgi:hypothetical protein
MSMKKTNIKHNIKGKISNVLAEAMTKGKTMNDRGDKSME